MVKSTVLYLYSLPGSLNEYGQIELRNEKEVRRRIRKFWGLKSTRGVGIREITKEKVILRHKEKSAFYAEALKANPHLCLTHF